MVLGVINLHGRVIPVLDLRRRFSPALRDYGLTARLLVVRTDRRILALAVDEVLGVREIAPEAIRQGAVEHVLSPEQIVEAIRSLVNHD